MWSDRISKPGPLALESDALPIMLRNPASALVFGESKSESIKSFPNVRAQKRNWELYRNFRFWLLTCTFYFQAHTAPEKRSVRSTRPEMVPSTSSRPELTAKTSTRPELAASNSTRPELKPSTSTRPQEGSSRPTLPGLKSGGSKELEVILTARPDWQTFYRVTFTI